MKNTVKAIATALLLAGGAASVSAQTSAPMTTIEEGGKMPNKLDTTQVPKEVRNVYIIEYPTVTAYDWYGYPTFTDESDWFDYDRNLYTSSKTGNPEFYIIEFTHEATPSTVIYSKTGKKIASHRKLKNASIPAAVTAALNNSKYKNWNVIDEKVEITKEADKSKVYKIKVAKDKQTHTLFFSDKGKLLKDKQLKS